MPQNASICNIDVDAKELMKHVTITVTIKNFWRFRIARPILSLFIRLTNCNVEFEVDNEKSL